MILAKKDVNGISERATRVLHATISELGTSAPVSTLQIIYFTNVEERSVSGRVQTSRQHDVSFLEQGQRREVSPEFGQLELLDSYTWASQICILSPVSLHAVPEGVQALMHLYSHAFGEVETAFAFKDRAATFILR